MLHITYFFLQALLFFASDVYAENGDPSANNTSPDSRSGSDKSTTPSSKSRDDSNLPGNGTSESSTRSSFLPKDCGRTKYDTKLRIIQGEEAGLGQFPWIVRIGIHKRASKSVMFFCGGSLINKYYVISAAHCEMKGNIVRAGENYVDTNKDCDQFGTCAPPHQDIEILSYKFNGYCTVTDQNDIALIELKKPAELNDFVQPICVPQGPLPLEDLMKKKTQLAGFGLTNTVTQEVAKKLMFIDAPIIPRQMCDKIYTHRLIDGQLCIGYQSGKDSCGGDSGGPVSIMMKTGDGGERAHLIGVVSYGLVKCGSGPAVYTDVSSYTDWISKSVQKG